MAGSMFKGMKNVLQKNKIAPRRPAPHIYPILDADTLLATKPRQQWLQSLRQLVDLSESDYDIYYLSLIRNFAEFAQQLPETKNSYYAHSGGLLDHGLERAVLAASLCRAYLLPKDAAETTLSPLYELWLFAVFSAALLLDVGKLAVKQTIMLCQSDGVTVDTWSPYAGTLYACAREEAAYYQYEFQKENRDRLKKFATPLIARQLLATKKINKHGLPISGFNWIATHWEILDAWLAMLNEDQTGGGKIISMIPLANAQTIANAIGGMRVFSTEQIPFFLAEPDITSRSSDASTAIEPAQAAQQQYQVQGQINASSNTLLGSVAASSAAMALPVGEAFLNWLKRAINSGEITVNKQGSLINVLPEGVLLEHTKLAQLFRQKNTEFSSLSTQAILKEFHALDLTKPGMGDSHLHHYAVLKSPREVALKNTHSTQDVKVGLLLNNPFLLFDADKIPAVNTTLAKVVETIERIATQEFTSHMPTTK